MDIVVMLDLKALIEIEILFQILLYILDNLKKYVYKKIIL